MTANMFLQRVEDAAARSNRLTVHLIVMGRDAGYSEEQVCEAINWTAIQLDPEADDAETWEATFMARLENPNSGER